MPCFVAGNVVLSTSFDLEDDAWDAFLAATPGGGHNQTSLWARLKSLSGWRPARVIARSEGKIVAGAQMLMRTLPGIGGVAYVQHGPISVDDSPVLMRDLIATLHRLARSCRIHYLSLQLPLNGQYGEQLTRMGFRPSPVSPWDRATVRIDLSAEPETILARMRSSTRYNIRLAQRQGIVIREGGESDLAAFYALLSATAQRQGFELEPESYLRSLWQLFSPSGHARIFLAEHQGERLSGALIVAFGEAAMMKRVGWRGDTGRLRPNELLWSTAITWARANGYRYFDVDGIDYEAAQAVLSGGEIPESVRQSARGFKLGFGGQVALYPEALECFYNPFVRRLYDTVRPWISDDVDVRELVRTVGL
ncbi:MAG: peptidoglycan bridge formation glycyltransferase FemA/FemB family protein [Oscillochloridaceae bacterium]|nr:peptidoglycan bridge formation glycyltransferase FemA/FemB family protein [Chloroflexaceae bacterium]MDW8390719.1 peptidoglycan bridge formation glycyltransferase FemA/FemB family protein [Oscillochloridaceae bacterium]